MTKFIEKQRELKIAICQMTSVDDAEVNLMQIEGLLERVAAAGDVRIVFLPENCLYLRLREGESIKGFLPDDAVLRSVAEMARQHGIHVHLGAVALRLENHLYNSSVHVTDRGEIRPTYQKMHLFDIQLEGQPPLRESDVFRHGQRPNVLEIDGWRLGETICYDLRFAELFSQYAARQVDAILVPSSFLVRTGEAHWEALLRARAIENQCYVIAAAQAGVHRGARGGLRETYGHSLVVDPWGRIAAEVANNGPGLQIVTLKRDEIEKVRRQIPMRDHRRIPIRN